MDFSEANGEWKPIPGWASFLIHFGSGWPSPRADGRINRRIALISMPCDSAGAGLITLGAMARDLSNPRANDIESHYDSLLNYARQYLEACVPCELKRCAPDERRCGYGGEVSGRIRSDRNQIYEVANETDFAARQLAFRRRDVVTRPYPQFVIDWHIDGEAPPVWNRSTGELRMDVYQSFASIGSIVPENLRRSYSGTCFAGRATGEAQTRKQCSLLRFRGEAVESTLDGLLTIHGWGNDNVSRVSFFNVRSGKLDRTSVKPSLVIADGDDAFLAVLDTKDFRNSDVIGVFHRTIDRDRLEFLGTRLQQMSNYYVPDEDMLCTIPSVPVGISVSILRRIA